MDRDLLEATVPQLEQYYATHRYTVVQVTQWYLDRIARFDVRYKAVITVDAAAALARARAEDAAPAHKGPLYGVPIVLKSNTSMQGHITNDGWKGFMIPGHELVAPEDATVTAHLRAAGAVILGQTNMPDFAASDTNKSTAGGRTGNAYDARFSPGGSSGGTVTAVTANFAMLGTGTDTGNSIRMPSSTSSVVGVFPTRGLVSIVGIAPLDWLLDNTGPIARDVTSAAIALDVMAGEDPRDFRTKGAKARAQPGPYTNYLKPGALQGKRFGVPAFILSAAPGATAGVSPGGAVGRSIYLRPETRALFLKALDGLRAAGATIVIEDDILPDTFPKLINAVNTRPYRGEGADLFLHDFGPAEYRSVAAYEKVIGSPIPASMSGVFPAGAATLSGPPQRAPQPQRNLEGDPEAEANFFAPQRAALDAYTGTLDKYHLDGFVYPAAQMPPNDETIPQPDGRPSSGPHSNTGWVNKIGVPAVVVPAGFYATGLPFGMEISARPWKDGDLLGWAYAFEQKTHLRQPPVLIDLPRPAED
jgi:Asp-tRNA(Asn)/Glu-tRNA(Gln) amidotransferase A subunit family amidase